MGSSACYFLSKRGYKVLGIEQFNIPHEQGSHAGQSRIIRKAYFEDPDYVPLLNRAYKNWKDLEQESGEHIYFRTGLVYLGQPGHEIINGLKLSASLYNIPLEKMNSSLTAKHFPQFKIPKGFETIFEPDAGFVTPEKAIKIYTELAKKNGAEIHTNEKVLGWQKDGEGILVTTATTKYRCNKLIITAGAWAGKLIGSVEDKIKITRQFLAWVKPQKPDVFALNNFPCWLIGDDEKPGAYYGFPVLSSKKFGEPEGLKLAHNYPGIITDPDNVDRQIHAGDMENLKYVLNKYLPGAFESVVATKICLYANTPDQNFIIDKLPGYEDRVTIACGFSGHGFKFVSVVGEILADLSTEGSTKLNIDFLHIKRFV